MAQGQDWSLSDTQFNALRTLVHKHTGISLSDAKRELVKRRFSTRLRRLNLASFSDYFQLLESVRGEEEITHFTNAITTNLTAFFRENHHFEALADLLLERQSQSSADRRIRIWSAGCSTGEEPYSLAMCLKEHFPQSQGWDVKILATDIDTDVLDFARNGLYKKERIADMPKDYLCRWFEEETVDDSTQYRVKRELKQLIQFNQLNLMNPWPMRGMFDAIFCRNVIIYFDMQTKTQLLNRFAELLNPGAHLFLGHSESLPRGVNQFTLKGKTIYQKVSSE